MAEEQEEKEGTDWGEIFGHAVRFMILCWSLAMMTLGYMDKICLLYTSPSPRDVEESRMPSSA